MLLNVIFLSSYSKTIERNLGSYYLFNVVLIFTASCAVVQMLLELFISFFYPPVLDDCISGYSGILFGVLVLALGVSVNKSDTSSYCCGYVPRGLYPLVVLLLIQLVTTEQISIIANLAGIITGYACILMYYLYHTEPSLSSTFWGVKESKVSFFLLLLGELRYSNLTVLLISLLINPHSEDIPIHFFSLTCPIFRHARPFQFCEAYSEYDIHPRTRRTLLHDNYPPWICTLP